MRHFIGYDFAKKLILVKIRLEKVDLGEFYIKKEQENFKTCSSSNTIWGPLHMSHPVYVYLKVYNKDSYGIQNWNNTS